MTDVDQLERAILEGARRGLAPSASDRQRIQSTLLRGEAWWQPATGRASWLRRATGSFRGGVVLGLALGTFIGYGASHGLGYLAAARHRAALEQDASNAAASNPIVAAQPPTMSALEAETAVPPSESATPPATSTLSPSEERNPTAAVAPPSAWHAAFGGAAKKAPAASGASAARGGSSLAEELSLLSRARRALNRNDAQLALGIVGSLDERFPNGVLMEERAATRILCLCELKRIDEARVSASHFLALHPASVYAERVRTSCAGGQ